MRVVFGDDGILFGDFVAFGIDRVQILFFKSDSEVMYSAGNVVGYTCFFFTL